MVRTFYVIAISSSLALTSFCGPSADELKQAEAERLKAIRFRAFAGLINREIQLAGQHCSETPEQFRQLVTRDSAFTFTLPSDGRTEPTGAFIRDIQRATANHDSTKSCQRIVDSVASALRMQGKAHSSS